MSVDVVFLVLFGLLMVWFVGTVVWMVVAELLDHRSYKKWTAGETTKEEQR